MKETKKQITIQVTNKLTSKFNIERERQQKRYSDLWALYETEIKNRQKLQEENLKLKEQIEKYDDWNRRLQEFCNMPDGEREKAIETFRVEHMNAEFVDSLDFFKKALGIMF